MLTSIQIVHIYYNVHNYIIAMSTTLFSISSSLSHLLCQFLPKNTDPLILPTLLKIKISLN